MKKLLTAFVLGLQQSWARRPARLPPNDDAIAETVGTGDGADVPEPKAGRTAT